MVGSNMALANNKVLTWYSSVTNTLKVEMQQSIPLPPSETDLVLLSMPNSEIEDLEKKIVKQLHLTYITGERFGEAKRIVPVLKTLGYKNVRICNDCSPQYDRLDKTNEIGSSAMFKSAFIGPGKVIVFINKEFID
jgi:hypothetical protein